MDERPEPGLDRRTFIGALATAGGASLAGCSALQSDEDDATSGMDEQRASELAARFAPTLYFDSHEPWFPTDPRPYTSERDGETIVEGFDALNGYHERYDDGAPPDPTVFYHGVEYEGSPLCVIQFWFYSVFDQFTTNFHWHDWEVLQVFVDGDSDEPQLYVASSHSRKVPNNEFLDPDGDVVPRILPELGSHSSTLSVNDVADRFQRVGADNLLADITNTAIEGIEDLADVPLAYGLPRDEGGRLPYVVPEFESEPIYDHERLPSVSAESLISEELTVRSFDDLQSPPDDLPLRETDLVFQHREREDDVEADIEYDLVESSEIEYITAFDGPQLSFEFDVPQAVEDAIAGHITTTGQPWEQPRYDNPAADISAPNHRSVLAERYEAIGEPAAINIVATRVSDAIADDDAPEDEGLTTTESSVESVILLESDPAAAPTFGGIAAVQGVEPGEHRLTVNGAGRSPHSENLSVPDEDATVTAGVDAEIPLVARENATKLEIDDEAADTDVTEVALEDDFAGRLYESPVDGADAVYVHSGGAYTTEVRDPDDEVGAYRVNPDPDEDDGIRIDRPETGKAPLSTFLADIAEETRTEVAAVTGDDDDDDTGSGGGNTETSGGQSNAVQGLERALAAVVEAARKAAENARAGERGNTDRQLEVVAERLQRVQTRLADAREELSEPLSKAASNRLDQATRRAEQAQQAETL
jgi:hypothetical protein